MAKALGLGYPVGICRDHMQRWFNPPPSRKNPLPRRQRVRRTIWQPLLRDNEPEARRVGSSYLKQRRQHGEVDFMFMVVAVNHIKINIYIYIYILSI